MSNLKAVKIFLISGLLSVANFVLADTTAPGGLPNPLGETRDLQALLLKIVQVIIQFGAVIAVFFMIYAGFLFIKASGNPEAISEAKKTWNWTAIGIMVLLGAQVITSIITGTLCQVSNNTLPGLCN